MKSICITGGCGFVGSNLADALLADGHRVMALGRLDGRGVRANLAWLTERHPDGRFRAIPGDVRDTSVLTDAIGHVDAVFHFAGQASAAASVSDPRTDLATNLVGTFNVLEAARASGRKPVVIFASSNKVYGSLINKVLLDVGSRWDCPEQAQGIQEWQSLDPCSPYGCSKCAADQYVRDYHRTYGLPTVVLRMSCIYGLRQFGVEEQGWLVHFMRSALEGKPVTIYGDGKQVRDVLFIDDFVNLCKSVLEKPDVMTGEVFNVGGGPANTLSLLEALEEIGKLSGRDVGWTFAASRPGDQRWYVSDIRKAEQLLGWRPEVGVKEGVRRTWEWVKENFK